MTLLLQSNPISSLLSLSLSVSLSFSRCRGGVDDVDVHDPNNTHTHTQPTESGRVVSSRPDVLYVNAQISLFFFFIYFPSTDQHQICRIISVG